MSRFINAERSLTRLLGSRAVAALAYPHAVDRYLESLNPIWSTHEVRARVVAIRHQTADTVTLQLRPNAHWNGFIPGQFINLSVEVDGVRRSRCFSPANSAHEAGLIELTARVQEGGKVTPYLKSRLQVGEVVTLSAAEGAFALPQQRPDNLLLISGGSGITPVMAMLRTLADEQYRGVISFLHYARSAADQLYGAELQALAQQLPQLRLLRVYEQGSDGEAQGRFNIEQLGTLVPDFAQAETFLCGPPGLMQAVENSYRDCKLLDQLHQERFTAPATLAINAGDVSGELRFAHSERLTDNDGRSILEQAETAGLSPKHGCRMGICSTCSCRKTSGVVRNLLTGELSGSEAEDVRICVSAPVGDVTLEL